MFFNLNVNEMSLVFSDRLMEIFWKQISNKIISCNDRDAPWISPKLKTAIKRNVRVYRKTAIKRNVRVYRKTAIKRNVRVYRKTAIKRNVRVYRKTAIKRNVRVYRKTAIKRNVRVYRKTAIKRNVRVYRKWVKRGRNENDHNNVREVQNTTNRLIREAKQVHYKKLGEKLSDPQTGSKHFWNAFIRITNKRKHTKIPPIVDNNTYVSNFQ